LPKIPLQPINTDKIKAHDTVYISGIVQLPRDIYSATKDSLLVNIVGTSMWIPRDEIVGHVSAPKEIKKGDFVIETVAGPHLLVIAVEDGMVWVRDSLHNHKVLALSKVTLVEPDGSLYKDRVYSHGSVYDGFMI